jgi:acyl carrier protein
MTQQGNKSRVESLNRADVLVAVCAELAKIGPLSNRQIRPNSDLTSELNIDSLDAISIILALNSRFGVDLPNMAVDEFRTPERITEHIIALKEANARLALYAQEA